MLWWRQDPWCYRPRRFLKELFEGSEPRLLDFRKIRNYNSAFAFTCFKYGEDKRLSHRGGRTRLSKSTERYLTYWAQLAKQP